VKGRQYLAYREPHFLNTLVRKTGPDTPRKVIHNYYKTKAGVNSSTPTGTTWKKFLALLFLTK